MIYIRKINAHEIGVRRGGKTKRAGCYLLISRSAVSFFPTLRANVLNDSINLSILPPTGSNVSTAQLIYHNNKLFGDGSRNERRLYLTRDLDPNNYMEPDDILVMKNIEFNNFKGVKLFLFKGDRDRKAYNFFHKLLDGETHKIHEGPTIQEIDTFNFALTIAGQEYSSLSLSSESIFPKNLELNNEEDIVHPSAACMIGNLRSLGYSPEEAIADLIDNSIYAGARNININFFWDNSNSYISIQDDGRGMTEKELVNAMRPASINPSNARKLTDLGRFGMGLKSATFSLGKQITVSTIDENLKQKSIRRWDLDHAINNNEWRIFRNAYPNSEKLVTKQQTGTLIVIDKLDRLLTMNGQGQILSQDQFLRVVENVYNHLSLVFHRFIEKGLRISFNDEEEVPAFDPNFLHLNQTNIEEEVIKDLSGRDLKVRKILIPNFEELPAQIQKDIKNGRGFVNYQGVYIYRSNRLIDFGGWFNLGKRFSFRVQDDFSLGRLVIDLTNEMDMDWRIDIKKTSAIPPDFLIPSLTRLANIARKESAEKFGTSKNKIRRDKNKGLWRFKDSEIKIEKNHPLYKQLAQNDDVGQKFIEYIKDLEKTAPFINKLESK